MTATLIAILLFFIFLLLSGIHIYWAFGGKWASGSVIPTKEGATSGYQKHIEFTENYTFHLPGN